MKILYAANNSLSSKLQLYRWLENNSGHTVKIAAYKKSSPLNVNIDWTLDCLLNLFNPDLISFDQNENVSIYMEAIKRYNPDLIISDLEIFTSSIAMELGIPVWQYSSQLLKYGLARKETYNSGIFSTYSYLFNRDPVFTQRVNNIIYNSEKNLVYSHFGDLEVPPQLKNNFEWARPYCGRFKKSATCHHTFITGSQNINYNIQQFIKQYEDTVSFCEAEYFSKIIDQKSFYNTSEYYCNLYNSDFFVCESQVNFLSDAFYTFKKPIIDINYNDCDSLINGLLSLKFNLAHDLNNLKEIDINLEYNLDDVKFNTNIEYLHEKLKHVIY